VFLSLLDPDPLVRGTDPDPDPSIITHQPVRQLVVVQELHVLLRGRKNGGNFKQFLIKTTFIDQGSVDLDVFGLLDPLVTDPDRDLSIITHQPVRQLVVVQELHVLLGEKMAGISNNSLRRRHLLGKDSFFVAPGSGSGSISTRHGSGSFYNHTSAGLAARGRAGTPRAPVGGKNGGNFK
jgi:hypothetical protein